MAIEASLLFRGVGAERLFIFLGLWRYSGWRLGLLLDLQTAELKSNEDFDSLI